MVSKFICQFSYLNMLLGMKLGNGIMYKTSVLQFYFLYYASINRIWKYLVHLNKIFENKFYMKKKLLFQWVVQNKDTCTVFCSILLCILQYNIMANAHNRVLYCFIQTANNVMGGIKQITMKEQ